MKWLEVELELHALHNPESSCGTGNEKAAIAHRTILSYALGGQVDVASMFSISGNSTFEFDSTSSQRISSAFILGYVAVILQFSIPFSMHKVREFGLTILAWN